jgi:pyrimidine operon attenuation protein/uracil phosphoribosyltransferase
MKNIILDSNDIINKIRRISFEIIEKNYDENEIFLFGILPNGKYLSNKISDFLNQFSKKKLNVHFLEIDKKFNYVNNISPEVNSKLIKNKVVIIVDDVMNSGGTIMCSIGELLKYKPKKIQIAVLIERYYKNFPLKPDYKGLELSTTETEHVEVILDNSPKVLIK